LTIPEELVNALQSGGRFLVLGHKEPDADCIGSQLAASEIIRHFGGTAILASPGPFLRPEVQTFETLFLTNPEMRPADIQHVLILDCSTPERLGTWEVASQHDSVLVVDHHTSGDDFGTQRYVDGSAPSCALLVYRLFKKLGFEPSYDAAKALMLGNCTDTGFFRHLDGGQEETLLMTADLSRLGVSLKEIFQVMNSGKTSANIRLMGRILDRHELWHHEKVVYSWENLKDRTELHADSRSSDNLYQLFLGMDSVEAVILLREEEDGTCIGGLRSRTRLDCGELAKKFSGGGHKRAAGFHSTLKLEEVRKILFDDLDVYFHTTE